MIESGSELGLPKIFADKLQGLGDEGLGSLEICRAAGVKNVKFRTWRRQPDYMAVREF